MPKKTQTKVCRWAPEIQRAICRRCSGLCCTDPDVLVCLDREEADRRLSHYKYIREAVGLEQKKLAILRKNKDGSCIYFDHNTRGCSIYKRRPASCRAWFCGRGRQKDHIWQELRRKVRMPIFNMLTKEIFGKGS